MQAPPSPSRLVHTLPSPFLVQADDLARALFEATVAGALPPGVVALLPPDALARGQALSAAAAGPAAPATAGGSAAVAAAATSPLAALPPLPPPPAAAGDGGASHWELEAFWTRGGGAGGSRAPAELLEHALAWQRCSEYVTAAVVAGVESDEAFAADVAAADGDAAAAGAAPDEASGHAPPPGSEADGEAGAGAPPPDFPPVLARPRTWGGRDVDAVLAELRYVSHSGGHHHHHHGHGGEGDDGSSSSGSGSGSDDDDDGSGDGSSESDAEAADPAGGGPPPVAGEPLLPVADAAADGAVPAAAADPAHDDASVLDDDKRRNAVTGPDLFVHAASALTFGLMTRRRLGDLGLPPAKAGCGEEGVHWGKVLVLVLCLAVRCDLTAHPRLERDSREFDGESASDGGSDDDASYGDEEEEEGSEDEQEEEDDEEEEGGAEESMSAPSGAAGAAAGGGAGPAGDEATDDDDDEHNDADDEDFVVSWAWQSCAPPCERPATSTPRCLPCRTPCTMVCSASPTGVVFLPSPLPTRFPGADLMYSDIIHHVAGSALELLGVMLECLTTEELRGAIRYAGLHVSDGEGEGGGGALACQASSFTHPPPPPTPHARFSAARRSRSPGATHL